MSLKLSRIRYALVVAKEGSFTRAALHLNLSQPSISEQIALLEAELGFPIFARTARGIVVTEHGRAFLKEADRVHGEFLGLSDVARRLRGDATELFTLGVVSGIDPFSTRAVAALARRFPKMLLTLHTGPPSKVYEWLDDDRVDAGFAMERALGRLPAGLSHHLVCERDLMLIAPPDHALARVGRPVDLGVLVLQRLIMNEPDFGLGAFIGGLFRDLGIRPNTVAVVGNVDVMKDLVRHGLGLAILPAATLRGDIAAGTLVALPIVQRMVIPLYLLRRNRPMSRIREQKFAYLRDNVAAWAAEEQADPSSHRPEL
jgi:DNA-binding transcriptional LysR family regulator